MMSADAEASSSLPPAPPAGGVYSFVTEGIEHALEHLGSVQTAAATHLRYRVVR